MRNEEERALRQDELPGAKDRLGRSYPTRAIWVPCAVELDNGMLRWSGRGGFEFVEAGFPTLRDFVELWHQGDEAIVGFARKWGVLGLCEHDRPLTHNALTPGMAGGLWCDPHRDQRSLNEEGAWEFLGSWRHFSKEALAILDVAISSTIFEPEPELVTREQMDRAAYGLRETDERDWGGGRRVRPDPRWAVAGVNRWLEWGDVRPEIDAWIGEDGMPSYSIRYGGAANAAMTGGLHAECFRLFGALAIELMQAVSRDTIVAHCRGDCGNGRIFVRRRSNQVYCDECIKSGAKDRIGQRKRQRKLKAGG